jgi:hypothetical protein
MTLTQRQTLEAGNPALTKLDASGCYACEASKLGLKSGQWPPSIGIKIDGPRTLLLARTEPLRDGDGAQVGCAYCNTFHAVRVVVYND